uniref:Uncharacterized protein n=1 Tax=Acrobeloides nanus TaxID=290746 RepID=A0A914EJ94_9BILA
MLGSNFNALHGTFVKTYGSHKQQEHCLKGPLDSIIGDIVEGNLQEPSAVAVCDPGKTIAILDNRGIRLFDYRNEQFLAVVQLNRSYRGLGCTVRGDFVTVRRMHNGGIVEIYSGTKENTLITSFPYYAPPPFHGSRQINPNPSFIDVSMDRVIVTDLACNAFTIFNFNKELIWNCESSYQLEQRRIIQRQLDGNSPGHFRFISGAKFDANGEILIADAGTERLQYFDKNGKFKHAVAFDDTFAYASGIAINSHHELMVCDRRRNMCKLYKLTGRQAINTYGAKYSYYGQRYNGSRRS